MAVIKSASIGSDREVNIETSGLKYVSLEIRYINYNRYNANILVSKNELLKALGIEPPVDPFFFPTIVGSVIRNPQTGHIFTRYTKEAIEAPWICPKGRCYSEEGLRDNYGNDWEVIK